MIQHITATIARVWAWMWSWFTRPVRPLKAVYVDELPERLDPTVVYILGEGSHHWFVEMICPCGCGATLQMSLLRDARPRWQLVEHEDEETISLHPSVWRKIGCRSHFFLRRGHIVWCPNR